MYTKEGKEIHW